MKVSYFKINLLFETLGFSFIHVSFVWFLGLFLVWDQWYHLGKRQATMELSLFLAVWLNSSI